jgi:two-component sensor histidine kinase
VEEQLRIQQQDVERRTSNVEQTVRENTMLLQEVHHRVRNNLQVMSSLLSMQINSLGDDDRFAAPLHKAHHRVLALALVHEQLFQCDSSAQLNFTDYVQSLLAKLYRAYSVNPDRVKLVTQIEPLRLKADDAMNCGLILNELLANALKHAFPDDRQGCIRIRLRRTSPTRVECSVTDDGIGLPPKFRYQDVTTLGLSLVPLLVSQMGGNLRVTGKPGAAFTFDWDPEK